MSKKQAETARREAQIITMLIELLQGMARLEAQQNLLFAEVRRIIEDGGPCECQTRWRIVKVDPAAHTQ